MHHSCVHVVNATPPLCLQAAIVKILLETVSRVREELDIEFEFINIGGGLGIPYRPNQVGNTHRGRLTVCIITIIAVIIAIMHVPYFFAATCGCARSGFRAGANASSMPHPREEAARSVHGKWKVRTWSSKHFFSSSANGIVLECLLASADT